MDFIEQLKHQARTEMLDSIVASLRDYPNGGGDAQVMAEVDRLIKQPLDSRGMIIDRTNSNDLIWERAAMIKQDWLDRICGALGMNANTLEEILEQISALTKGVDRVPVYLIHGKGTKNYEVYENPDMDFRTQEIKVRMWIPRSEFETDIPGVVPSEITVEVLGNTTSEALNALNESW